MIEWMTAAAGVVAGAIGKEAGSSFWKDVLRPGLASLFSGVSGKLGERRAKRALENLDRTAVEIESSDTPETAREKAVVLWEERLEDLLADLDEEDREPFAQALAELAAKVEEYEGSGGGVSASDQGIAAGRDVNIKADRGSVAANTINGGVHLGNPRRPEEK